MLYLTLLIICKWEPNFIWAWIFTEMHSNIGKDLASVNVNWII